MDFFLLIFSEFGVANTRNVHHIRASKNAPGPHGKPVILYSIQTLYGAEDMSKSVTRESLEVCKVEYVDIDRICPCVPIVYLDNERTEY